MDRELVRAGEWVSIRFRAPRLSRRVQVYFDAGSGVDAWALPADELENFDKSDEFDFYAKARRSRVGWLRFTPERRKDWVLVFDNNGTADLIVEYEVTW